MIRFQILQNYESRSFKLWESQSPLNKPIVKEINENKLRNSAEKINHLQVQLHKLRTSLSKSNLNYFATITPSQKNKYIPSSEQTKINNISRSPSKIVLQMNDLSLKLSSAKKTMEIEKVVNDTKTIRIISPKEDEATCSESKQSIQETQRNRAKAQLHHYSSMKIIPSTIRPITTNPYQSRNDKYYISEVVRALHQKNSQAMDHINQSIQMLLQYKLIKMSFEPLPEDEKIYLPKRSGHKKTLFIDLDQTLIHCFQNDDPSADIKTSIKLQESEFKVGFNIRPNAFTFLKKMKKKWEIIVFTASHQLYADVILDEIDPDNELFDHRLYRHHCKEITEELYVKDLSRFNRQLSQSVLVDNSSYSYALQIDNGIPIFPYFQGKDFELTALESYLNKLVVQQDVRLLNRQYFRLYKYTSFDNSYDLVTKLYCANTNQY